MKWKIFQCGSISFQSFHVTERKIISCDQQRHYCGGYYNEHMHTSFLITNGKNELLKIYDLKYQILGKGQDLLIYFHKKSSFKIFNMIESCYRYRRSFKTDIVPLVNIFGKGFIFALFWQLKNKIILISIQLK